MGRYADWSSELSRIDDTEGFRLFAGSLERTLATYEPPDDLLLHQRAQLKGLIAAEATFRKTLLKHKWGPGVYRDFVVHICDERKNILAARPFFRERQTTFTATISKSLKKRHAPGLYKYRFNWTFIVWVLGARKWHPDSPIRKIAKQIEGMRTEILQQNIPLAISQARIFWNSTPKSHLTYMDIVQIQCQALLLAIDKFTPPDESKMTKEAALVAWKSFRGMAVGVMKRDRVNSFSETLVHFYPGDKLKIYTANRNLRQLQGELDYSALSDIVNRHLQETNADVRTNPEELAGLLAGASTVSGDFVADPDGETVLELTAGDAGLRPDAVYEGQEAEGVLHNYIRALNVRERKLLVMKGVSP